MAQPPKRPTTRRPKGGTTTRRTASRSKATPAPTPTAPAAPEEKAAARPRRGRPPKAAAGPAPTPAPAAPPSPPAPARARRTRASRPTPAPTPTSALARKRHDQADHQARDSHGRFKVSHRARNVALGVGGLLAAGIGLGTAFARGWLKLPLGKGKASGEGHAAPDLAPDAPPPGTDRAPDAFRPDPTATPTAEERDAMRPLGRD